MTKRKPISAFSLAEVLLAVGIVAFSLTSILGLFVLGLKTNRESHDTIEAAHLAGRILAERSSLPKVNPVIANNDAALPTLNQRLSSLETEVVSIFDGGPIPKATNPVYLKSDGSPVSAQDPERYYRMDYIIDAVSLDNTPPASPPSDSFQGLTRIYLCLSWPANAPKPFGRYELTTCQKVD